MAKINKQTNKQTMERNLSFKSLSQSWARHKQYAALSIVGTYGALSESKLCLS